MHSERPASLILGFLLMHVDRSPGIEAVPSHTTGLVPLPPALPSLSSLSSFPLTTFSLVLFPFLFLQLLFPWYFFPILSHPLLCCFSPPPSPFSLSPGTSFPVSATLLPLPLTTPPDAYLLPLPPTTLSLALPLPPSYDDHCVS